MKGPSEPGHVVCFGELLLRLSPDSGTPLDRSDQLDLAVGGAEANVVNTSVSMAGGWVFN